MDSCHWILDVLRGEVGDRPFGPTFQCAWKGSGMTVGRGHWEKGESLMIPNGGYKRPLTNSRVVDLLWVS